MLNIFLYGCICIQGPLEEKQLPDLRDPMGGCKETSGKGWGRDALAPLPEHLLHALLFLSILPLPRWQRRGGMREMW